MLDDPPKSALENEAEELLSAGQFGAAAARYEQLVQEHGNVPRLLVGWAKALIGDGRLEAADQKLSAAIAAGPTNSEAYVIKASMLAGRDLMDEALAIYEQGSEFIDEPDFYVRWGNLLTQMKKYEQARWRFTRAISIDDQHVPSYLALGEVLLALDLPGEAAKQFRHVATELEKTNGAAFSGWADALLATYKPDLAVEKLERAIELDGASAASIDHWLDIADIRHEQNQYAEALTASRAAMDLEKSGTSATQKYRSRHRAAVAAVAMNLPKAALAYSDKGFEVLARSGSDPAAEASFHFATGAARTMLRQYGEAIISYERAAAFDAFAIHSTNAIAAILAAQGRYSESWQELARLGEALERVERLPASALDDEQWLAYGTGQLWFEDLDKAQTAFESAVKTAPRNPNAWAKLMILCLARCEQKVDKESDWKWRAYDAYCKAIPLLEVQVDTSKFAEPFVALGLLHLSMEELDKAKPQFEKALALDRSSMIPFAALGLIELRRGRHTRAIEQFNSALVREPDNLTVKCYLADAYFQLGRHGAALDAYEDVLRVAPDNVGARMGAGESLIELAENSGDDLLYADAAVHLGKAIDLAHSVKPGCPNSTGSTGLGVRQWADLYYAHGYVQVKLYETEVETRVGPPSRSMRKHLNRARNDFEAAARTKVNSHRAERAVTAIRKHTKRLSPGMLTEIYAPFAVVAIASVLLITVQIAFFSGESLFADGKNAVPYTTLTLALLVTIAAGFYLPQVLKLKLGGIQLEKTASQLGESGGLNVPRHPFQANLHAIFEPTVPRSRMLEQGGSGGDPGSPSHARKGLDPDTPFSIWGY